MNPDIHALSGAYVLDALDEQERAAFARHMDGCEACALEVAELRETAARLADDVWSVPPPRLRENVLARIGATRQEVTVKPIRGPRRHRQSWRHRTTIALVAASLIGLVTLSGVYIVRDQRASEEQARIAAVLSAPDVTLKTGQVSGGGRLTVVTSPSRDAAVITLADATSIGDDRAYQLWFLRDGRPLSAGVLPAGKGDATRYVTGLRGMQTLALTLEPAGGSPIPTPPILGQVPL
jgi:anti-sigma-K factor RskA